MNHKSWKTEQKRKAQALKQEQFEQQQAQAANERDDRRAYLVTVLEMEIETHGTARGIVNFLEEHYGR
jgi:hypothetical protein